MYKCKIYFVTMFIFLVVLILPEKGLTEEKGKALNEVNWDFIKTNQSSFGISSLVAAFAPRPYGIVMGTLTPIIFVAYGVRWKDHNTLAVLSFYELVQFYNIFLAREERMVETFFINYASLNAFFLLLDLSHRVSPNRNLNFQINKESVSMRFSYDF